MKVKVSLSINLEVENEEEAKEAWMFLFKQRTVFYPNNDFFWEIEKGE